MVMRLKISIFKAMGALLWFIYVSLLSCIMSLPSRTPLLLISFSVFPKLIGVVLSIFIRL